MGKKGKMERCNTCRGQGTVQRKVGETVTEPLCGRCGGTGKVARK